MNYSCCIEMLFTEYPFAERIYRAKECGFDAVEFWTWQDKDLDAVRTALRDTGMKTGIFQGNIRGRMVDARDREEYVEDVLRSMETAKSLGAGNLFLMSELLAEDRSVLERNPPLPEEEKLENTRRVLEELAPAAERAGIRLVIEPLNTKVDHRGYSLCHSAPAFGLIREIGSPWVRVLYDAYHMQIMEGNLIETIRENAPYIGYFHVADVPGRHEPGTGEIQYPNVLAALREAGYDGTVGFEFSPSQGDSMETAHRVLELFKGGDV